MLTSLDVAIGVTFYFLLISVVVMAAGEVLEIVWKKRTSLLRLGTQALLQEATNARLATGQRQTGKDHATESLTDAFYGHPLIRPFGSGGAETAAWVRWLRRRFRLGDDLGPAYVPPRDFALALFDLLGLTEHASGSLGKRLRNTPGWAGPPPAFDAGSLAALREALRPLVATADTLDEAALHVERWYNSQMDQVAGWYKRHAQKVAFVLGLAIAVGLNADAIAVVNALTHDDDLRAVYVAAAGAYVEEMARSDSSARATPLAAGSAGTDSTVGSADDLDDAQARYEGAIHDLRALGVPLGWEFSNPSARWPGRDATTPPPSWRSVAWWWLAKVMGLLGTGIAVSLGAPFWFDLLNKMMVVRSVVKPHEKSPAEGSEDRRPVNPEVPDLRVLNARLGRVEAELSGEAPEAESDGETKA